MNHFVLGVFFLSIQTFASDNVSIYFTPFPNHQPVIDGINKASKSVQMVMFHLEDKAVEQALIDARARGLQVDVILDGLSLGLPWLSSGKKRLEKAGVHVVASSKAFKITHQKTVVIDHRTAYITSMNLTKKPSVQRDWGIITEDQKIIAEMNLVFEQDLKNAATGDSQTPTLTETHLLWSPVNAKEKLIAFIASAKSTIDSTVENLGNAEILAAFSAAAARGVKIRLIVPYCDIALSPQHNLPFAEQLVKSKVEARLMPDPQTPEQPYMHAKMILVDHKKAYVGSVNFSDNSLLRSREAGLIFENAEANSVIENEFEKDWTHSLDPSGPFPNCGK